MSVNRSLATEFLLFSNCDFVDVGAEFRRVALNPKTDVGEHTRPRVSLDAPRVQQGCARDMGRLSALSYATKVFCEAELTVFWLA